MTGCTTIVANQHQRSRTGVANAPANQRHHAAKDGPARAEAAATVDAERPATYPRRVLVVVTGMTPQVVTETIYALAVAHSPAFTPTEVRLLTTRPGAELAKSALLDANDGWFHRLRRDYDLPPIAFDAERIHVLVDAAGAHLDDIRTPAHNTAAADAITQLLCELTRDESSALHVSIAGGRKTMGFYLGYALSLYGRPQDRLSHVLVNQPYESLREFFYPTPMSVPIETSQGSAIDAQDGEVALAEIPFVRLREGLREGLPEALLEGKIRFHEAVDAAQRAIGPVELVIDLRARRVRAGGRIVGLPPTQLAFLAWLAQRQKEGLGWLPCPLEDFPEKEYAAAFLRVYEAIIGPMGDRERTDERLKPGMDRAFFSQTKSKLHSLLNKALGKPGAAAYLVSRRMEERGRVYGFDIPAVAIRFGEVPTR